MDPVYLRCWVGYLVNMGIDWDLDWIPIEIDRFLTLFVKPFLHT